LGRILPVYCKVIRDSTQFNLEKFKGFQILIFKKKDKNTGKNFIAPFNLDVFKVQLKFASCTVNNQGRVDGFISHMLLCRSSKTMITDK